MSARTAVTTMALLALMAGGLAGCTDTISGTPGPRPTVSGGGDFPSGDSSETPTDEPTDQPTDQPTDEPTDQPTDEPTDEPTGVTTTNPDSVETLCANLGYANAQSGSVGADTIKTFVSTVILAWGIANSDTDPYSKADAATTSACPDTRTKVLDVMGLPDLASTEN